MKLFRRTIELSDKEMKEFVKAMAGDGGPRVAKRDELEKRPAVAGYWDELAAAGAGGIGGAVRYAGAAMLEEDEPEEEERRSFWGGGTEEKEASGEEGIQEEAPRNRKQGRRQKPAKAEKPVKAGKPPKPPRLGKASKGAKAEQHLKEEAAGHTLEGEPEEVDSLEIPSKVASEKFLEKAMEETGAELGHPVDWMPDIRKFTRAELRTFLAERCDNILEAKEQMEVVRLEYQEVTSYLQDTQLIGRLPEEDRSELADAARHILALKMDMNHVLVKKARLSDFQYQTMERYAGVMPSEIERLRREEEQHTRIKEDLHKLEGEKGALAYEKEEEEKKRVFLGKLGLGGGIFAGMLFALYLTLFLSMEAAVMMPFLVTAFCAAGLAAYLFVENRRSTYALKMNEKKRKKLISLQNRVKIKYVNNTAALDYSCDKYGVNNSKELAYRWEQYVMRKDEEERQRHNRSVMSMYEVQLVEILEQNRIHDPEVWLSQAQALLDGREMVEIRHRLNVRRQKLRERIAYNTKLRDGAEEELRALARQYPEERARMQVILDSYGVTI